ncbi:hypothetical protein [Sulfitobacter sp. G21635-S1]|uniref:hypothetical protein n=1 Tax=Rhodobacterales TaxID=204455 RepID=UPI0022AEDB50|nr:hypothetical protein [Sulfitobacter sp. G21635-S1]MCZ4258718.1 hypothetical protein [Sulfitobacter sp. G21635-S1]
MDKIPLILAVVWASSAGAQETCIEPFRPDAEYLADGGFSPEEMREEFRTYFSEVEDYLNCLNRSGARIRQEATAAAQDYNHVLDRHPVKPGQRIEQEPVPRVELSESGTLFLDYEAEWLQ